MIISLPLTHFAHHDTVNDYSCIRKFCDFIFPKGCIVFLCVDVSQVLYPLICFLILVSRVWAILKTHGIHPKNVKGNNSKKKKKNREDFRTISQDKSHIFNCLQTPVLKCMQESLQYFNTTLATFSVKLVFNINETVKEKQRYCSLHNRKITALKERVEGRMKKVESE